MTMERVALPPVNLLYAWELGANFGHIGAFLPLARALRERGLPTPPWIPG